MSAGEITEAEFDERFGVELAPDGSFFWDEAQVRSEQVPAERVWTAVQGDDSGTVLRPGWALVNRFAHVVSERPRTGPADDVDCVLEGDDDDDEGARS